MAHNEKYRNESQDARRHDKQISTHPHDKISRAEARAKRLRDKKMHRDE